MLYTLSHNKHNFIDIENNFFIYIFSPSFSVSYTNALFSGEKGIGFKSVFRVTDRPSIHSGHFNLHFDATVGSMGYILPHHAPTVTFDRDRYTR